MDRKSANVVGRYNETNPAKARKHGADIFQYSEQASTSNRTLKVQNSSTVDRITQPSF